MKHKNIPRWGGIIERPLNRLWGMVERKTLATMKGEKNRKKKNRVKKKNEIKREKNFCRKEKKYVGKKREKK